MTPSDIISSRLAPNALTVPAIFLGVCRRDKAGVAPEKLDLLAVKAESAVTLLALTNMQVDD